LNCFPANASRADTGDRFRLISASSAVDCLEVAPRADADSATTRSSRRCFSWLTSNRRLGQRWHRGLRFERPIVAAICSALAGSVDTILRGANMNDPIRDDTTPAFCEPYPLMSFEMPPVRSSSPEFVHVSLARTAVDAWSACDPARLDAAMEAIRNTIDPTNANTGPAAPIQGQG